MASHPTIVPMYRLDAYSLTISVRSVRYIVTDQIDAPPDACEYSRYDEPLRHHVYDDHLHMSIDIIAPSAASNAPNPKSTPS